MKVLVDQQLPPSLKAFFEGRGIDAVHVSDVGLETQKDRTIWEYAKSNGLEIVSKDEDFLYLAYQDQSGPRLIWVRLGNCSSAALMETFERLWPQIEAWGASGERVVEIR